jgi:NAD+ synthase
MSLSASLAAWLRQQVHAAGSRGIVVGLSGGVDSAVVARASQLAFPENVVTVIMPAHSDPRDAEDAKLVADTFKIPVLKVDLTEPYDVLLETVEAALPRTATNGTPEHAAARLALANVKPRMRMTTLYYVANRLNYLVAGTGNRSEIAIGYYTKYGDGGVDLLPLGAMVKSQVRSLARELGVPTCVVEKAPSAGLWMGQTDEGEMGFTYADLEEYLSKGPGALAPAVVMKIERLARASEHKRHLPPVFEP